MFLQIMSASQSIKILQYRTLPAATHGGFAVLSQICCRSIFDYMHTLKFNSSTNSILCTVDNKHEQ